MLKIRREYGTVNVLDVNGAKWEEVVNKEVRKILNRTIREKELLNLLEEALGP